MPSWECDVANELNITGSALYSKNGVNLASPGATALLVTVAGNGVSEGIMATSTSPAAIPLAGLSSPFGWAFFKNLDPTNNISLQVSSSGAVFAQLNPNEIWQGRLGSGVTAPYAVSAASTPLLAFQIFPP
jgi:hypothetical protein